MGWQLCVHWCKEVFSCDLAMLSLVTDNPYINLAVGWLIDCPVDWLIVRNV